MKKKLIGLIIVAAVVLTAAGLSVFRTRSAVTTLSGYVGGEKIGFLEDEEVQKVLRSKYHLSLDYAKAGSLDMVTADKEGKDYLWPSSQTALELYKSEVGKPVRSDIIFNTPIVIYTHKPIAQALEKEKIVSQQDGIYTVDLKSLVKMVEDGTSWKSIGLDLYGNVTISSTDPTKSNSGNMYAGLLANTLTGGVATEATVGPYLDQIRQIFEKSGYMESSSADIFNEFLKMGMGSKPLVVGYESQLLEFSAQHPDTWNQIKDDIIMLYPTPTVWSSHVMIALDDQASGAIDALEDEEIQKIAWEKHGFRTGMAGVSADLDVFQGMGLEPTVDQVVQMPNYRTMKMIIDALSDQ